MSEVPLYHISASFPSAASGASSSSAPLPPAGGVPQDHNLHGHLAHKKTPTPLGPPWDPRHMPPVGSEGGGCFLISEVPLYIPAAPGIRKRSATGVPRSQESASSWDPAVGLCLAPYGGPRGRRRFLKSEVPLHSELPRLKPLQPRK